MFARSSGLSVRASDARSSDEDDIDSEEEEVVVVPARTPRRVQFNPTAAVREISRVPSAADDETMDGVQTSTGSPHGMCSGVCVVHVLCRVVPVQSACNVHVVRTRTLRPCRRSCIHQ